MLYLGIDPGAKGGLACINDKDEVFALRGMPETLREIWEWFKTFEKMECFAVLEQVSGYIGKSKNKDGAKGNTGKSMFTFGQSYGSLEMALVACSFQKDRGYWTILPQRWQRGLGLKKSKEVIAEGKDWKTYLKEEAHRRFPKIKTTLKTGDALLIAQYCKILAKRNL